jgi:hypothetical protein
MELDLQSFLGSSVQLSMVGAIVTSCIKVFESLYFLQETRLIH